MTVNEHGVDPDAEAAHDAFVSEQEDFCSFEKPTGDKRWPVLCDKDSKYCTHSYCETECSLQQKLKGSV